MNMEELFKMIGKVRGIKRVELLNKCSDRFYMFLKNNQYTTFNKSLLKAQFPNDLKPTAFKTQLKQILDILLVSGRIEVSRVAKSGKLFLRQKPLYCNDNESYFLMMKSNGYKVSYYNMGYDKVKRCPKRTFIKTLDCNITPTFNFDIAIKTSNKAVKRQAVYSNSVLSIGLSRNNYNINVFKVN